MTIRIVCGLLRWCEWWLVTASCFSVFVIAGPPRLSSYRSYRNEAKAIRDSKSKEMLKYMNLTIDPCNDFFEFACGNWAEYHPAEKCTIRTTQNEVKTQVNRDLQTLLESISLQDNKSRRKVKYFYRTCLDTSSNSVSQKKFLMEFVRNNGGMPSLPQSNWHLHHYDWVQVVGALRSNFDMNILIGLTVDTNLQTKRGSSIYLSEPADTLLAVEICSAETMSRTDINEKPYEHVQNQIADDLQNWFSLQRGEATRTAGDIVTFEFNLCRKARQDELLEAINSTNDPATTPAIDFSTYGGRTGQGRLYSSNRHINNQYMRQTPYQLTQFFGGLIDFKKYLDITFGNVINSHVYLRDETYFTHLARLLKITAKPTIANYIMYRALNALRLPLDGLRSQRLKFCNELVLRSFPKIVGSMYSEKYYRQETKSDLEAIYQQISKAFDDSLTVEWMDENTRRVAKQKLAQLSVRFPQYNNLDLTDFQIEGLDYWHQLEFVLKYTTKQQLDRLYSTDYYRSAEVIESPDVDVRLQPMDNELMVGWGLMQPPLYHIHYPNALKYAVLGQRLGKELTLAFDEQGWNRSSLSPLHWGDVTVEAFRNRTHCFRMQFSNYLHNNPEEFRNATRLRQLVSDGSGLNIAFRAYLDWLDYIDPRNRSILNRETLTEMNFTNTQLFFIGFAQARCAAVYIDQPVPEFLPMDKHTNERYDVNGPLSNFNEFAREFNCAVGTEMNPDEKCVVY